MSSKALRYSLLLVALLSVLFPMGAYFGVVVVFISAIKARKSRQVLGELAADPAIIVMLFSTLLSGLYSKDKLMSFGGLAVICMNIGLYLVLVAELNKIRLKRYYQILNIGCILACIYGIYQYASGNLVILKSWMDENTFGSYARIYSTLLNPNIFAAYLSINLSFAMARFRSMWEDILLSINITLSSICLLLTYSRGGFAAFGTGILILCILKKWNKGIVTYLTAMITVFVLMNSTGHASRVDPSLIYKDSSSLYRIEIWKAAWSMFLANPVSGHGIGTTWYYLSSGSDRLYSYILHSHNIYLQVAAEMGIIGLFAFTYMSWRKVYDGIRLMRGKATDEETCIVQGFLACAAGIAVHGLVDAVVFVPAFGLVLMCYSSMYGRVVSNHSMELSCSIGIYTLWRPGTAKSLESKGVLKLLGGKGACKDEYQEEEGKACQA